MRHCLLVIGTWFFLSGVATAASGGVVAISPPAGLVPQQGVVTLTVNVDFSADPTQGGAVDLAWNPAEFQFEAWYPNVVGDPGFFNPGSPLPGQVQGIVFSDPNGIAGPVDIGRLTLRAIGNGASQINVQPNLAGGAFISAVTGLPQSVTFDPASIDIGPPLNASDADTPWRHVAINNPASACPLDPASGCPQTPSWNVQRLFQPSPGGNMPPALQPFCVYQLSAPPTGAQLAELAALQTANCVNAIAPDALAVTYMGGPQIEPLLWPALRSDFLARAGQLDSALGAAAVRLAIVDTQPAALAAAGNSRHGFSLRGMASELLCADGPCGVDIVTNLGLPMLRCDTDARGVCQDDVGGGHMSTISQLAAAIRIATVEWLALAPADRLVINLSVAWHPRFGRDPGDGPQIDAVLAALADASCRGALVVAAAGNRINEPSIFEPADPLLPGGWEVLPAPDELACTAALEGPPNPADFPPGPGVYRPLLYAAGALGSDDAPVATRVLGEPRLAAFGDHAVALADVGGGPTQVQTGTSVASLVVSAAAVAAWAQAPDAPAFEVMLPVYDAGADLGRMAEFFDDSCATCDVSVRRIRVCEAAIEACGFFGGGPCSASCADEIPDGPRPLPTADLAAQFVPTASIDLSQLDLVLFPDTETCGDYALRYRAGDAPDNPCPQFQFWGVQAVPYASGQPSSQPCEVCVGILAAGVYLDITPDFEGTLSDLTLRCDDSAYHLPVPASFGAGDSYLVTGTPATCATATLAYSVTEPGDAMPSSSVSSTLILDAGAADSDGDGVVDSSDNCLLLPNPVQRDTDGDDIGNACDPDMAPALNDCIVNAADLGALRSTFLLADGAPGFNPDGDFNGDGVINVIDLSVMKQFFFEAPGPSGLAGNLCGTGA